MSTLELENIKHPDNSGNNVELAADGSLNIKPVNNQGIKISATSANSANYLDFYDIGGGPYGRLGYDHNASAMTFRTYTSEKMRLSYEGRLGIGTSTPLRKLHLADAGDTHIILQSTNAVDNSEIFEIGAGANAASKVDLTFRTRLNSGSGGTEHMRITNDGYVKTPNQPGFKASGVVTQLNGQGNSANYVFDNISYYGGYNTGNHYSTSTGIFTVPSAGVYIFGTNIMGDASDARLMIRIKINGVGAHQGSSSSNSTQYQDSSAVFTIKLSENDTVSVGNYGNKPNYGGNDELEHYFWGHLLG